MDEYIECDECGFVLLSDGSGEPNPRRVEACPRCGAVEFRFTET